MKPTIFKAADLSERDFGSVQVTNILDSVEYPTLSVNKVKVVAEQQPGYDQESDIAYYVLEGTGVFTINQVEYPVEPGDLLFIPKGTVYKDTEGLTLLAISTPRFDPKQRVRVGL